MVTRMARESGIEMPTAEALVRLDRNRRGKTLSNAEWQSPTDPDARIARLKKTAERIWPISRSMRWTSTPVQWSRPRCMPPTATTPDTLTNAIEHLTAVDVAPTPEAPAELIAD